jgi:flagellin-like protein
MSKGLTPVIAMILLLMMTVAAAGASFYWLLRIQGELQGGTQQFQEQTFEQMTSMVGWQSATYSEDPDLLYITVVNRGTTKIPIDNESTSGGVQWILLDNEQDHVCTSDWDGTHVKCNSGCIDDGDLLVNELRTINLTLKSSCNITAVTADQLMFSTIYFGGKASASGQFRTA